MRINLRRHVKVRLRTVLIAIALIAATCQFAVPWAKRTFFPATWNRWIVRTETKPDGSTIRIRVRRYPDHDVVTQEILVPAASAASLHPSNPPSLNTSTLRSR